MRWIQTNVLLLVDHILESIRHGNRRETNFDTFKGAASICLTPGWEKKKEKRHLFNVYFCTSDI